MSRWIVDVGVCMKTIYFHERAHLSCANSQMPCALCCVACCVHALLSYQRTDTCVSVLLLSGRLIKLKVLHRQRQQSQRQQQHHHQHEQHQRTTCMSLIFSYASSVPVVHVCVCFCVHKVITHTHSHREAACDGTRTLSAKL